MSPRLDNRVERLLDRAYAWARDWPDALTESDLARYRMFYAASVLLLLFPTWNWVASFPRSWWAPPPGPFALLSGPPPGWVLVACGVLLGICLGALFVGWRTRVVSWLIFLLWMFGNGVAFSWGKIDHSILLLLLPVFFAEAGWGNAHSVDHSRGRLIEGRSWMITAYALCITLGMMTAAAAKLATGWLSPSTQAVRGHLLRNIAVEGRGELLAGTTASIEASPLWIAADVLTVAVEGSLLVLLYRRSWFRAGLLVLIAFHIFVLLSFNISFLGNVIIYGALFAWPLTRRPIRGTRSWWVLASVSAGGGLAVLALTTGRSPGLFLLDAVGVPRLTIALVLMLAIGGLWLILNLRERRTEVRGSARSPSVSSSGVQG